MLIIHSRSTSIPTRWHISGYCFGWLKFCAGKFFSIEMILLRFWSSLNMEVGLSIVELACSEKKVLIWQSIALCVFSYLVCFESYEFFDVNLSEQDRITVRLMWLKMGVFPFFFWNLRSLIVHNSSLRFVGMSEIGRMTRPSGSFLFYPCQFCYRLKKIVLKFFFLWEVCGGRGEKISSFLTGMIL